VETAPCQQCHDPHASSRAGLFRETLHPPFEEGDCTTCHALPGSATPFRTKVPLDRLCGECHEDQVTESRQAAFPHVSAGGGNCAACHNPHTADGAGLLKASVESLCLECHDPAGSAAGDEGRFPSHGDGLECTTCHSPHGGEQPLLLAEDPVSLCSGCHSHQHSSAHPQGEGTRDPRSGQPMDCLSCHGIHDAPYPKYMHLSGDRDLCVSCHQAKAGR
jgi:predicted CXXCH cytochrome family protein